jgi:hypothetical protein
MIAKENTKDEFLNPQNSPKIQQMINESDQNLTKSLEKDNRDTTTDNN